MDSSSNKIAIHSATSQTLSQQQEAFYKQFALLPVKRMEDLITTNSPPLHQVDREALVLCISAMIGKYLNFIGCSNSMDKDTTIDTAQMMIDTHRNMPVDAIKTFFYECKRGSFGFHYNKMDGTKMLMWFDKFVQDFYQKVDDAEYAKHQNTKGDLANPISLKDEEGEHIDFEELYASFHGKTREQVRKENRIKEIRMDVCKKNMHLYSTMSVADADRTIDELIQSQLKAENLIV